MIHKNLIVNLMQNEQGMNNKIITNIIRLIMTKSAFNIHLIAYQSDHGFFVVYPCRIK